LIELPEIPDSIKRIRIDIGLSFDAPHAKDWISEGDDIFVFGFEPVPENCKYILDEIKSDRFHLYECAVSDTNENRKFNVTKHNTSIEKDRGHSSFYEPSDSSPFSIDYSLDVRCITLSSFLDLIDWDRFEYIDYVKIDAQGHDFKIIKIARPYFDRLPRIKLESTTQAAYKNSPDSDKFEIANFMSENGYTRLYRNGASVPEGAETVDHFYERRILPAGLR